MGKGKPKKMHRVTRSTTRRTQYVTHTLMSFSSPPLTKYYKENSHLLPSKGQYINIHSNLMGFFARGMFRKLWEATGELIPDPELVAEDATHPVNMERIEGRLRLSVLDRDNDGYLTVDDIHYGLRDFLGLSVDDNYKSLAEQVHSCADVTGTGRVTVEDFELFLLDMPREMKFQPKWQKAFPDPLPDLSPEVMNFNATSDSSSSDADNRLHFPFDGPFMNGHNTEQTDVDNSSGSESPPTVITIEAIGQ